MGKIPFTDNAPCPKCGYETSSDTFCEECNFDLRIKFDKKFIDKIMSGAKHYTIRRNPRPIGYYHVDGENFRVYIAGVHEVPSRSVLLDMWDKCGFDSREEAEAFYKDYLAGNLMAKNGYAHLFALV